MWGPPEWGAPLTQLVSLLHFLGAGARFVLSMVLGTQLGPEAWSLFFDEGTNGWAAPPMSARGAGSHAVGRGRCSAASWLCGLWKRLPLQERLLSK